MVNSVELAATLSAENKLREMFPEEYDRYFREVAVKTVTVCRTSFKEVTEEEAEILCRHGWTLMEELNGN